MRLEKLNKLTKVQRVFADMKKVCLGMGEIELHQIEEGVHMVGIADAEKRITVSGNEKNLMVIIDYKNKNEFRYKKVKTQQQVIDAILNPETMEVETIGATPKETTKKVVEKSAVAPLESPVKITPEVTAMNVTRESESARQLEKLIKLEGNKAYEVLDYGCGLGRNIKYLLENTNCFVDGCDTEEQVKNISKDAEKMAYFKNQGATVTTSDKLESGYEFMLNSHVLNVVMDDVKKIIIDDMYRLLAKNGKLVIQVRTESDVASAKSKEKYGDGWLIKKGKETTYQEGITKEKMHRMLTGAGFKIINHRFTKSIHMVEVTK